MDGVETDHGDGRDEWQVIDSNIVMVRFTRQYVMVASPDGRR